MDLKYTIKQGVRFIAQKGYPKLYGNMLHTNHRKTISFERIIRAAEKRGYHYYYPFPKKSISFPDGYGKYDLSLIIPVYNVEAFLPDLIQSLLNQKTDYRYELIFINDGSQDNSLEILKSYTQLDNVTIITQKNQGLAAARNKGMDIAKGKYYGFVDSDDSISENHIQLLMSRAFETDADIVKGAYYKCYGNGQREPVINERRSYKDGLKNDVLKYAYAWGAVYKNTGGGVYKRWKMAFSTRLFI